MRKLSVRLFSTMFLFCFPTLAKADWDGVDYFPSERINAAGRSGYVFLDGWEGSVLNPASETRKCSGGESSCSTHWVLRLPYIEASDTALALTQKKGVSEQIDFLEEHLGESMMARVNADLGYVEKNWALGLLYQESYRAHLFLDLDNFGLETLNVNARRTIGISGAYRYAVNEKINTGASLKLLRREVHDVGTPITDFGAVTDLKNLRNFDKGYVALLDLGVQYTSDENSGFRGGIIIRQLADGKVRAKFPNGTLRETIPQSIDLASGYRFMLPYSFKLDLSFDFNDTFNRVESNAIKRTHAGFALNWHSYNFYSGLNGGYICFGFNAKFGFFALDLGTTGLETSNNVGTRQDRRYYLSTRYSF